MKHDLINIKPTNNICGGGGGGSRRRRRISACTIDIHLNMVCGLRTRIRNIIRRWIIIQGKIYNRGIN